MAVAVLLLVAAACSSGGGETAPSTVTTSSPLNEVVGGERPADLSLPASWSADGPPLPLVVVLHGYGASGRVQDLYLGVSARRDELGYMTVAPDGSTDARGNRFWNVGIEGGPDDTAYLAGLIDEIVSDHNADADRVYVVGHSNGGFMANKLACERPDSVTGIASIAGGLVGPVPGCAEALDVLIVHGTDDLVVPYDGGLFLGRRILGAEQTINRWVDANGCDEPRSAGSQVDFDLLVGGDETTVTAWTGCSGGQRVELWTMEGSGHVPGLRPSFRTALMQWLLEGR